MATTAEIDPQRLYSSTEAARLVPSSQGGTVYPNTLRKWRREGLLVGIPRRVGRRTFWFYQGAELLRFLGGRPAPEVSSPARRKHDHDRAVAELKEMGL